MAEPPLLIGAVQDMVTWAFPAVAVTPVGAPGTVLLDGVTDEEGEDATLVPAALVAVTVKVYAVPLVSPATAQDVVGLRPASIDVEQCLLAFCTAVTV